VAWQPLVAKGRLRPPDGLSIVVTKSAGLYTGGERARACIGSDHRIM
jgi:hypothetical protein